MNEPATLQSDIIKFVELQNRLDQMLDELKRELVDRILYTRNPHPESPSSPVVIVRFNELLESSIWDPKYYSQVEQAKAVEAMLKPCADVLSLMKRVAELVKAKCVNVPNNKVALNKWTVQALQSSELYKAFLSLESKEDLA